MTLDDFAVVVADTTKNDVEVVDSMFKVANPSAAVIWQMFNGHRPKIIEAFKQIAVERFVEDLEKYLQEREKRSECRGQDRGLAPPVD